MPLLWVNARPEAFSQGLLLLSRRLARDKEAGRLPHACARHPEMQAAGREHLFTGLLRKPRAIRREGSSHSVQVGACLAHCSAEFWASLGWDEVFPIVILLEWKTIPHWPSWAHMQAEMHPGASMLTSWEERIPNSSECFLHCFSFTIQQTGRKL